MPRKRLETVIQESDPDPEIQPDPEPERLHSQAYASEPVKTKKPVSAERKQHLDTIRPKALEAKRELKEITMKAKLAKNLEKMELAKKYDEHMKTKIQAQQPQPLGAYDPHKGGLPTPEIKPQKPKRIVKKIIEVESSEESEVEEEVVYVKKKKDKQQVVKQPPKESLNHLLYESAQERLQARVMEERLKARVTGYQNSLTPMILGNF